MNKLCKYNGVLTVLIPDGNRYYTHPLGDDNDVVPLCINESDPNIKMISIAKLHFSDARQIIRTLIDDVYMEDAAPPAVVNFNIQAEKPALGFHAVFNREY